jgi:hypothetical protein
MKIFHNEDVFGKSQQIGIIKEENILKSQA